MNFEELKNELARRKKMFNLGEWRCCLNCEFFIQDGAFKGTCQKAGTMPPLTVIVVGCEMWRDDIPF